MMRYLIILCLCLVTVPAAAQLSLLGIKNSMVQFLFDQISTEGAFEITAEKVDEPEDGVTAIVGLAISDSEGVWLKAESLNFSWSPTRLLLGEIEFANLALSGVDVLRKPVPGPESEEEPEPEEPSEGGMGFKVEWPRSPLALKIERMALEQVRVAEGVLGHAITFDATGSAADEGDIQAVTLNMTRLDAVEGVINFEYELRFDLGTFKLKLDAKEGPNGLIAALSGLPPEATTTAKIDADGPPEDWRMVLDIDLAEMLSIDGTAALSYSDVLKIDAGLTATPGPRLEPDLAALIGERAEIRALVTEDENGLITIENGYLKAPDVSLLASGTYDEPTGGADLKIDLEAGAGLAAPIEGVSFNAVTFDGSVTGAPGSYRATGKLDLEALATDPVDVAAADLVIDVSQSKAEDATEATTRFSVNGITGGLRLDRIGADILGDPKLDISGELTGNALTLQGFELVSEVLTVALSGTADLETQDADVTLDLSAPDFGPVAAAYDQTVTGAITARGKAVRKDGVLDLDFDTSLGDFSHEMAAAKALTLGLKVRNEGEVTDFDVTGAGTAMRLDKLTPDILGELTLGVAGQLDGDALTLEVAKLSSVPLTVEAAGTADLKTQHADLAFNVSAPDMAPVAAAYGQTVAGAIAAEGAVLREDGVTDLIVVTALTDLAHEFVDARALDLTLTAANRGERTAFVANGTGEAIRLDRIPPDLLGIVSFDTSGVIEGDALLIEPTTLRTDLLEAKVDGALNLANQTGAVTYALTTGSLGPIAALYDVELDGEAAVSGRADLTAEGPRITGTAGLSSIVFDQTGYGDLNLEHDVTVGEAPAGTLKINLTKSPYGDASVVTDFVFTAPELKLTGLDASALGARVNGNLALNTEKTLAEGALTLKAGSLRPLSGLAGTQLAGAVDGTVKLSRPGGRQNAVVQITGRDIAAADAGIATLDLNGTLTNLLARPGVDVRAEIGGISVADLALDKLTATAAGPLSAMAVTATTAGLLEKDPVSLALAGQVDGDGPSTGIRLDRLDAALAEETVSLNQPMMVRSQGATLSVSDMDISLPRGGRLAGEVTKYGRGMKGNIALSNLDAGLAKRFADAPVNSGIIAADATFDTGRGPATVVLTATDMSFEGVDSAGDLDIETRADWDGRIATTSGSITGGFGQPLTFSGSLPVRPGLIPTVAPSGPVEGSVDWEGKIDALWALIPAAGHLLSGSAVIDMGVTGDISDPRISGGMSLTDGGYQNLDLGTILTELTLDTQITPEGALSFELDGKDGGSGTLTTKGKVALDQSGIEIETVIDKAVLIRRDDVTARIDGDITVAGPANALAVDGTIGLETVEVRLVSNASANIVDLGEIKIKGAPEPEEEDGESSVTLNIDITSPGRVFVRGRGLDSSWGVDLQVRGTAAKPILTGAVERVRGTLELIGKTFDLTRGEISFDGRPKIDPRLDIAFERETTDLTGRILVTGLGSDPKLNFSSSPSLPEDEVLPRTIFGKSSQSLTGSQAIQLAIGIATLLDGGGGTLEQVRGAVGLDSLRVEQDEDGNASVAAGKEISEGIFVGAKQGIGDGESSVVVEIDVFEEVGINAEVGQTSGSTVGVRWKRDF